MLNQFYSSNIYVHVLSALLGMKDMQMVFALGMIFNTVPVNTTSNLSASSSLKIYLRSVHFLCIFMTPYQIQDIVLSLRLPTIAF